MADHIPRTVARAGRVVLYLLFLAPLVVFPLHAFSVRWFYPQAFPTEWTIEPFVQQAINQRTLAAAGESARVALLVSSLSLLVGYPAARVLGMREFASKGVLLLLFFIPMVISPLAAGMGLNVLFLKLNLAGTVQGVVLVHLIPVLPYTIFALMGVFARYDSTYEQQALVLGAGKLRIFLTITLPLVLPGVVVAALFAFLVSWSEYLLTLLIGGGQVITLPILLFSTAAGGNPTTTAALALLFLVPPMVIIAASTRYLLAYGVPGIRL